MSKTLSALAGLSTERDWPRVQCPECETGRVGFESAKTYKDPTSVNIADRFRRGLDGPDELSGTFTGTLCCDDSHCRRQLAMAGDWVYAYAFDEEEERERFVDFYAVKYVNPPIRVITPPEKTPQEVRKAIDDASALLWLNPNAAANLLRRAVEHLLTARGVRKTVLTRKGTRERLSAHARIVTFKKERPDVADAIMAVKWIGNSGSHDGVLTVNDVLDGASYLSLALRLLYDTNDAKLLAEARAVSRRKGISRKPVK